MPTPSSSCWTCLTLRRKAQIVTLEARRGRAELEAEVSALRESNSKLDEMVKKLEQASSRRAELEAEVSALRESNSKLDEMVKKSEQASQLEQEWKRASSRPAHDTSAQNSMWRNIHYGHRDKRHLEILDTIGGKQVSSMIFGQPFEVIEEQERKDGDTTKIWLKTKARTFECDMFFGWVLAKEFNSGYEQTFCINLAVWEGHDGPIPDRAFVGQPFPHEGMFTEGFAGAQNICVVSASGDNMWRQLNIEMLFRNIATATVFEQDWGGDANFTDWVAFYAMNVAVHGELGAGNPKKLIVTVKNTKNWTKYPLFGPKPDEIKEDIGRAQLKECCWLWKRFQSQHLPWDLEFLTTFQFFMKYCNWSKKDCQNAAEAKFNRHLKGVEGTESLSRLPHDKAKYIFDMLYWCLVEAFGDEEQVQGSTVIEPLMITQFCLDHGFASHLGEKSGYTPLHKAAELGKAELIPKLRRMGLNINGKDREGRTPFSIAYEQQHVECAQVLEELGTEYIDADIFRAAERRDAARIPKMAGNGANVNSKEEAEAASQQWKDVRLFLAHRDGSGTLQEAFSSSTLVCYIAVDQG